MILKDEVLCAGGNVIEFLALPLAQPCGSFGFFFLQLREKEKEQSRVEQQEISPTQPVPAADTTCLRLLNCSHPTPQS